MITYPGMKLSEAGAVEFCARQGSGGMLAEPRTEDEMDALQEGLAYWRGEIEETNVVVDFQLTLHQLTILILMLFVLMSCVLD